MIDDAFYAGLMRDFPPRGREIRDPQLKAASEALLAREARLLDQGRFDEWLALYAQECLYWVPARPDPGDPRREVCVAFDDRRRLEDRIYRLRTGSAWSQAPASRTVRLVSNLELFEASAGLLCRSNFLVQEFRAGEVHAWAGWAAHRLRARERDWEIEVKQVNLLDSDQSLRNPSIVL